MRKSRTNKAEVLPACGEGRPAGRDIGRTQPAGPTITATADRARALHWLLALAAGGLVLAPVAAAAQDADPKPRRATLAYFGERVTQPGVRIGYEGAALFRSPHELLLAGNLGGFAVTSGYALMVLFEGGYRVTAPFGGFFDLRPGIGYTAAWIDTGGLTNVSNYLTLSALGGVGYDFYRRLRVPISLLARSGIVWRSGTGPVEGLSYALDIGIAYQFGTGRPKPPTLPVALPPPAEAPPNLDDPLVPIAPTTDSAAAPAGEPQAPRPGTPTPPPAASSPEAPRPPAPAPPLAPSRPEAPRPAAPTPEK